MTNSISVPLTWLPHGEGLDVPQLQSALAAGVDVRAALDQGEVISLMPGDYCAVPCGFAMALPPGFEAQVRPRSGLALKHGVTVLNAPGTIDADYRGEVKVLLINHGKAAFDIRRGERIAQIVIAPVTAPHFEVVSSLDETARGGGGFGSTGGS